MTDTTSELLVCPAYGWSGGPAFETLIKKKRSGGERRNGTMAYPQHSFTLPFQNIIDETYLGEIKNVFMATRGRLFSFLAKDVIDYKLENQLIAVADGATDTFQLIKTYTFGSLNLTRIILAPRNVAITVNGVASSPTIDTNTGKFVMPSMPSDGDEIRATGEFRIPVRFANDQLAVAITGRRSGKMAVNVSIDIIEVFE